MRWGVFKQKLFCLHFFHVLLDCILFEINISYSFGDIKAINLLCQQPLTQLIITLKRKEQLQSTHKQAQCSLTPKCLGLAHELYLHALLYSAKFLRV